MKPPKLDPNAEKLTVQALVAVLNRPHILKILNEELGGALEALGFPRSTIADSASLRLAQSELYAVEDFDFMTNGEEPNITPNIVAGGRK